MFMAANAENDASQMFALPNVSTAAKNVYTSEITWRISYSSVTYVKNCYFRIRHWFLRVELKILLCASQYIFLLARLHDQLEFSCSMLQVVLNHSYPCWKRSTKPAKCQNDFHSIYQAQFHVLIIAIHFIDNLFSFRRTEHTYNFLV